MTDGKKTLRHTILLLDYSRAIKEEDYRPNRQVSMLETVLKLIDKFEENNPLSLLSVYLLRDLRCTQMIDSSNSHEKKKEEIEKHLKNARSDDRFNFHSSLLIKKVTDFDPVGQISLYNGLQVARGIFEKTPMYYHREIVLVLSSTGTNDAKDIYELLEDLVNLKVKINIISMSGTNYLFKQVVKRTGGKLYLAGSKLEFEEQLFVS